MGGVVSNVFLLGRLIEFLVICVVVEGDEI